MTISTKITEENKRQYRGFNLKRTDPYGFWFIEGSDGKLVSSEAYTNIESIKNAIDTLIFVQEQKQVSSKRK